MRTKTKTQKVLPFTPLFPVYIVVDNREQRPYTFESIRSDQSEGGGRLMAISTMSGTLDSGDYSLEGHIDRIAVERKSKEDLFGTLGRGRDRFIRELERLTTLQFAAVVVECEWSEIIDNPPPHTELQPKTVLRSVIAWQQRFRTIHWNFVPGRAAGEVMTFRILQRYWKDYQERLKEAGDGTPTTLTNS